MLNSFPSLRIRYLVHPDWVHPDRAHLVWRWLRWIVRLSGWLGVCISPHLSVQGQSVSALATHFVDRLGELALPIRSFDYQQELKQIPSLAKLEQKQALIHSVQQRLDQLDTVALTVADHLVYDQLRYELSQHQRQLRLEQGFHQHPLTPIPTQGLFGLADGPAWYAHYVRRYTNTELTPAELFAFGQQQVGQAQRAIDSLQVRMGYGTDANAFQRHLKDTSFFMADTGRILGQYRRLEQRVRGRLSRLFIDTLIGPLSIQAWQGATPAMPPAIYQPERHAFAINLATGRYNRRTMNWVLLHEGLPGHHYQASQAHSLPNPFQASYYYLGNLEGWGCYAESLGSQLGLYQTAEQELGRWEWDLVRSVRVVLDVGIHVRGWTFGQALAYWQATIQGQDELAEREIRRVTQWPGQCLSYKVGAWRIEQMKRGLSRQSALDVRRFHQAYLRLSSVPLNLVEKYIPFLYDRNDRSEGGASPR